MTTRGGVTVVERLQVKLPEAIRERLENGRYSPTWLSTLSRAELAQEQTKLINRTPGGLTGYDCPECLNRGYFLRVDEKGYRHSRQCRCMALRRGQERLKKSGLGDLVGRYSFDTWQVRERWQQGALEMAKRFVEDPDGHWFLMAGQVGAGKSHLCAAVTAALMEKGLPARYMLWRDTAVKVKAVVNDDGAYEAIMGPLKRVRVLYIDDLFKGGNVTSADVNLAFELLNSRYNDNQKITILSSERSIEDLLDIDEGVGSRIYERSKGFYLALRGVQNWRLQRPGGQR